MTDCAGFWGNLPTSGGILRLRQDRAKVRILTTIALPEMALQIAGNKAKATPTPTGGKRAPPHPDSPEAAPSEPIPHAVETAVWYIPSEAVATGSPEKILKGELKEIGARVRAMEQEHTNNIAEQETDKSKGASFQD